MNPSFELISVDEIARLLPKGGLSAVRCWAAQRLHSWLALDRINTLYAHCCTVRGGRFAAAVLDDLQIRLRIEPTSAAAFRLLQECRSEHRPFVVISNHPFGALDGIALLAWLTPLFPDFRLMANALLMRIEALRSALYAVDPEGSKLDATGNRNTLRAAYHHVAAGAPLGLFPAGSVEHISWRSWGHLEDAPWRSSVVRWLLHLEVPVLPVRFVGGNSFVFHALGLIHWRVRSLRLPREVFARRGETLTLRLGTPILPETLRSAPDLDALSRLLRRACLEL
jgi:putative hemolysin